MKRETEQSVVVSASVPKWVESIYREEAKKEKRSVSFFLREDLEKSAKRRMRSVGGGRG